MGEKFLQSSATCYEIPQLWLENQPPLIVRSLASQGLKFIGRRMVKICLKVQDGNLFMKRITTHFSSLKSNLRMQELMLVLALMQVVNLLALLSSLLMKQLSRRSLMLHSNCPRRYKSKLLLSRKFQKTELFQRVRV